MKSLTITLGVAAVALPAMLSAPAQAYTAYQSYLQGRGVYVSSKANPPGGLQSFFGYPGYPPLPPGPGYYAPPPPPPGYGYGYPPPAYGY